MSMNEQISNLPDEMLKKQFLKLILKDVDVSDEKYQESFKDTYKVNIDISGAKGYQIYKPDKYVSKSGENLEDANVTIITLICLTIFQVIYLLFFLEPFDLPSIKIR